MQISIAPGVLKGSAALKELLTQKCAGDIFLFVVDDREYTYRLYYFS